MRPATTRRSSLPVAGLVIVSLATALSACGGGGDSSPPPRAHVSSATVSAVKFGGSALVSITGSNLDQGLSVTSSQCDTMTLQTTGAFISTPNTAYYACTVSDVTGTISVRDASGIYSPAPTFTVPLPRVTLTVQGGVTGDITIDLAADKMPETVTNFLAYVNGPIPFYQGTIFHRTVDVAAGYSAAGFIQGGGYLPTNDPNHLVAKATNAPVAFETDSSLHNTVFTIAAWRADSTMPNSATSQFIINTADNSAVFDPSASNIGLAVFGTVTAGTDKVLAIQNAACVPYPSTFDGSCLPVPDVVISSAQQIR